MNDSRREFGDDRPDSAAETVVRECVAAGREAMAEISGYDQEDADGLARAAAWAVYEEDHAESLVDTTVKATGMGGRADKREKLRDRTKGTLLDALEQPSVGEIPCERDGVVELAKPVGVVGGLVPSTNAAPTAVNLAILALKGRNAVVLSASPAGLPPTAEAVEYIREELARAGAPRNLVQVLPGDASKAKSNALVEQADLVQVTGSAANVRAGEESGTPNYCVSEGNPVAVLDRSVDPERVASDVVESAAYDEGTACIAESCLVAPDPVYQQVRDSLAVAGAYRCDATETARIRDALFPGDDPQSDPDRALVGRPADELAAEAGVDVPAGTPLLAVEPDDVETDPLVTECLAPLLATVQVPDFEAGLDVTVRLLDREGAGHSVAVHTTDRERAVEAGRRLDVCRAVVNQPNLASSGTVENGLTHTFSMGGGTWAGNQLAENLSVGQFVQTTRVAFRTEATEPSDASLFGPHVDGESEPDEPETTGDGVNDDDSGDGVDDADDSGDGVLGTLSTLLP